MEILNYLMGPIVGGVIGYITNALAIKMLFRPYTAKYIFGIKIPFTPGIIPKEKSRIAGAIGEAISTNLMNREVLERTLLSDEMISKIENGFDEFVSTQKNNSDSLKTFLSHYLTTDDISQISLSAKTELTAIIGKRLISSNIGEKVAQLAVQHVLEKVRSGFIGMFGADKFISMLASPVEKLLGKHINDLMAENGKDMVNNMLGNELDKFLDTPMKELFRNHEQQLEQAKQGLISVYRTIILERLPKILETIDISKIIEERVNEMDMKETEAIIFQTMDKELKAIVWLGAFLGMIMGCINTLF